MRAQNLCQLKKLLAAVHITNQTKGGVSVLERQQIKGTQVQHSCKGEDESFLYYMTVKLGSRLVFSYLSQSVSVFK